MKLDFIVVSLPRSFSTFAANWLTTNNSICWHDATGWALPEELDIRPSSKKFRGISCTGAWMWNDWFESHPAKKIIIERDIKEINESLVKIGLSAMPVEAVDKFKQLKGLRIRHTDMLYCPKAIWNYLLPDVPFDSERHDELVKMNIQPIEQVMVPDAEYVKRTILDLKRRLSSMQ